jgi:hypothetical protein
LKGKVSFSVSSFKFDAEFESKEELRYIMATADDFLMLAFRAKIEKKFGEQLNEKITAHA